MKKPYLWLQENEAFGHADCGCILNRNYEGEEGEQGEAGAAFWFCPLHEAAGELLEAVKSSVEKLENYLSAIGPGYPSYRDLNQVQKVLRQAWVKAEGGRKKNAVE